jgi:hypothetical protein
MNQVFWDVMPCGSCMNGMLSSGTLRGVTLVRTDFSEEHWFLQEPHGVTSHKSALFMVTAMKPSNLT